MTKPRSNSITLNGGADTPLPAAAEVAPIASPISDLVQQTTRQLPKLIERQTGRIKEARTPHPELYSLRFWAFLLIFAHHFLGRYFEGIASLAHDPLTSRIISALFNFGSLGLDMFFCLSSFLVTGILLREFDANGRLDITAFLARRALRIFPLYFGFLALTTFVLPRLLPGEHLGGEYLVAFLLFGANWICTFKGFPPSVAAPLWSVSGEQQFYALWPVLIGWLSPRRIVPLAVGCIGVSTVVRVAVLQANLPPPAIWANTLAHLDPIAVGALCSVCLRSSQSRIANRRLLLAFGIGLPACLLFVLGPSAYHGPWSMAFYPAAALACGSILLGVYRHTPKLHSPWLVHLGKISYGLFVFHTLAIQLVDKLFAASLPSPEGLVFKVALGLGQMATAFILTIGIAILSYRYFEKPFLQYKTLFRAKPAGPAFPELAQSPVVVLAPK